MLPTWLVWLASWVDPEAAILYPVIDVAKSFDNSATKKILGIEFKSVETSVKEMSETLIETGYVPDLRK